MNQKLLERTKDGVTNISDKNGGTFQIKVPENRSALSVVGFNTVWSSGDYREDGWVYIDDKPVHKWFVHINGVRVWEPRLTDLNHLYKLFKKVKNANTKHWNKIEDILKQLWSKAGKRTTEIKAHCIPTHKFEWYDDTQPWWVFKVQPFNRDDGTEALSFSFDWLDTKPEKVLNRKLGEALYQAEQYWWGSTSPRLGKVRSVFYTAMKRTLPEAIDEKVICMKFDEDTFWFYTKRTQYGFQWEMFDDVYKFEIKDM
jgi:hypothetical protein